VKSNIVVLWSLNVDLFVGPEGVLSEETSPFK